MRKPGKMSVWKFFMYFVIGSILGALILGTVGYLVTLPRGGNVRVSIIFGAIFGAIFGGPLLASNLEKER